MSSISNYIEPTQSIASSNDTTSASHTSFPTFRPHGLNTGGKVGIGVGVPIGAIAIIAAGFLIVWYKRRQKADLNQPQQSLPVSEVSADGKVELDGAKSMVSPTLAGSELDGKTTWRPELASTSPMQQRSELSSQNAWQTGTDTTTGWRSELHGQSYTVAPSELASHPQPTRSEMDASPAVSPVSSTIGAVARKQVGSASPRDPMLRTTTASPTSAGDPDPQVSIMPGLPASSSPPAPPPISPAAPGATIQPSMGNPVAPSAEELSAMAEAHARLEARRQRLMELEKIEREQAVLQERMKAAQGRQEQER
jgi:hypothetical protein